MPSPAMVAMSPLCRAVPVGHAVGGSGGGATAAGCVGRLTMTGTEMMAAAAAAIAAARTNPIMRGCLHGAHRPRSWVVLATVSRTASTVRSGACVGPASSQSRRVRSYVRSSFMPVEPPGPDRPCQLPWPCEARASRNAVGIGPCRPGCRASRRSRPAAGPGSGAGRRWLAAPPGSRTKPRSNWSRSATHWLPSGVDGSLTGMTRTLVDHRRRRPASA